MRLLLVEDNVPLAEAICLGLKGLGHTVDAVHTAEHGLLSIETESFDVVLLDINLPKMSGLDLLKKIREQHIHTAVIMLTARDTTADKITGLDLGADDYLVKPFELDELDARLRAVIRRLSGSEVNLLTRGEIRMDVQGRVVKLNDELINLSRKEFNVLQILLEANGRVVTTTALESKLYSWDEEISSNSIQVHISNLRKKLGKESIKTLIGIGYVIE